MSDGTRLPVPFPATRWSLVGRAAAGSEAAAAVVETYAGAIAAYLRLRLGDVAGADLDDVVQDVLAHLLANPEVVAAAKPGAGSRFRYYLTAVAWNEARNALRRRRRGRGGDDAALLDQAAPDDAAGMDRAWAEAVIAAAWSEVMAWIAEGRAPAETRAVLEACLRDGLVLRDAAERIGLSLATCQRRLALGRTLLQKAIADRLSAAGETVVDPAEGFERLMGYLR